MTVQPVQSEESEDAASPSPRERAYRRKYQLLLERCDVLQQDNERILNRIHEARGMTRRYKRDVEVLGARLDRHADAFRAPPRQPARRRNNKVNERDPRVPKKPCNAFFQFCVSQRPAQAAGSEPERTRRLAERWRELPVDEKRVYVDMFHRSRLHYRRQMCEYAAKTTAADARDEPE